MKNYTITYTANNKAIGDKVLTLNKFDQVQLQNKFDEYAAKMQPGDILEYTKDDLSSKKAGGLLLYVENEKGVNYIYNLNNNRKKKYKVQPTAQPKSEAYGKSKKQPIQVDYAQESLSEMIRRVIKEESYDKITQEEVDTFYKNFYTAMNNLEIIQKLTKNDKFRIYIRKMDDMANEIIKITG